MENWFTVEKIDRDTYAISEYKHWERTHCYLLLGREKALLIDTGLGISNIRAVVNSLTDLPVTVVTTHVHWDHIGGHRYFETILVHEAERSWLADKFPLPLQVVKGNLTRKACAFPAEFCLDRYKLFQGVPAAVFRNGDQIDLGNRSVVVIHTPGHSPGHCCFYEPDRKYLYSGDLIYRGCLDAFYPTTDPEAFFQSVRKVSALEVSRILPGHHELEIPVSLRDEIASGFEALSVAGKLHQGSGIIDFGSFQIHL